MTDLDSSSATSAVPSRTPLDAKLDERRIASGMAIGLPLVTISVAAVVGVLMGPATSILVVAAGLLLGVIAILWASLRVLSGDAPLSPELEALEMATQGVDALASRKKMLLRALKDLENEHAIGKIEDDDFAQVAATYREDLKGVLKRIDTTLEPHRSRAEDAIRAHLVKAGLVEPGYRGEPPPAAESEPGEDVRPAKATRGTTTSAKAERLVCPKCAESNEPDAKFCKECATKLSPQGPARSKKASTKEVDLAGGKTANRATKSDANDDDDTDDDEDDSDA